MLLTDARRPARTGRGGELIPMAEQDRGAWNSAAIAEGIALLTHALPRGETGPYQLQAAISALHDEATDYAATDWPQIVALYQRLMQMTDNPMIALNHAVAVAMATGPAVGLTLVDTLAYDPRLADDHRLHAVRAHLLELSGDHERARRCYTAAAEKAVNLPQKRYLHARAARLS
jgi:predicted RNA polymerase sigma factor